MRRKGTQPPAGLGKTGLLWWLHIGTTWKAFRNHGGQGRTHPSSHWVWISGWSLIQKAPMSEWFRSTVSVTQHCAGEGGRLCALGWLMYFEKGHSHQLHVMRSAVLVSGGPQAHSPEQSGNQLTWEAITALILALWLCSLPPTDQTCQKPVCLTDNVL